MHPGKSKSVLISGGSGLIGMHLTSLLLEKGYTVSHLSRKSGQFGRVRVYRWDPEKKIADHALTGEFDYIIHLAGAGIGEKRWTRKRKSEILSSREDSAKFLFDIVKKNNIGLSAFISASGTGYYGTAVNAKSFDENDPPGNDFLGMVCKRWEEAADKFSAEGIRTVKIRTGVVLAGNGGILEQLSRPFRYGLVIRMGSGRQYMPWIHISDLCRIYFKALEDTQMSGAYNAVAPENVTHNEFMKELASVNHRKIILPPVPGFMVKLLLGEMADIVIKGNRVSAEKILSAGYSFEFPDLRSALNDIYSRQT
ncbi:MAG: TIGR01777 family protein [Bacteroidales bacterium]|nr:TIGR01777 family protein [Bacteroidales bacterium]